MIRVKVESNDSLMTASTVRSSQPNDKANDEMNDKANDEMNDSLMNKN